MPSWLCVFIVLQVFVEAAVKCPGLDFPAPDVVTVMKVKNDAFIIHPNCTTEKVPVVIDDGGRTLLDLNLKSIVNLESYPPAKALYLATNSITSYDFTKDKVVSHLVLSANGITSIADFKFPDQLNEVDFQYNSITELNEGDLPKGTQYLILAENKLISLEKFNFPSTLVQIDLSINSLRSLEGFVVPESLTHLNLNDNSIRKFEHIAFPEGLKTISATNAKIKVIRGIKFPPELTLLNLGQNEIKEFEIRETDAKHFENLETLTIKLSSVTCSNPDAKKQTIQDQEFCVISDETFEKKYAQAIAASAAKNGKMLTKKDLNEKATAGSSSGQPSTTSAGSSSSNTLVTIVIVIGVIMIAGMFVIGIKLFRKKTSSKDDDNKDAYTAGTTTNQSASLHDTQLMSSASMGYLKNDVRNDEELILYRIAQEEVTIEKTLGKGGNGIIYLASYRGKEVAVKHILAEKSRNKAALSRFMDEIRMCANLSHPKVVGFIGITWSTLLDLAVVIEYIPNGDLYSLLKKQHDSQQGADNFTWFQKSNDLPSKATLALDIVEALVYLHSFEKPIIHRDLKSRNILLTDQWEGKLSDFGISRETELDETMTGEVGTVAWIAPEVLQGEMYSEKADIYSFGVILSELDTCRHPYRDSLDGTGETSKHTNTRIAMLVSAGVLKPSLTDQCPSGIRELALKCLSYQAAERPNAIQIHYELRKIGGQAESQWRDNNSN